MREYFTGAQTMNKPKNEPLGSAVIFGNQLRYVSKRRLRKLKARHAAQGKPFEYREIVSNGKFLFASWLRALPPGISFVEPKRKDGGKYYDRI